MRLTPTFEGMVAIDGLLEAEAGQMLLAALEPLAHPANAEDDRSGGQRTADALTELARRQQEGGRLPQTGGVRPQLTVTVDLDSLQGRPGLGGDTQAGALDPEACRRLGCDGAVTRVLVTRHPTHQHPTGHHGHGDHGGHHHPGGDRGLAAWLRTAAALLPPTLGWGPKPAPGGRLDHPGRPARPTHRPGRPRRRLGVPQLRPAPFLVRSPSSVALAGWRPHRPGQPGPPLPGPPPRRA